ncbi:hypothetical protein H4W31_004867 [Plantactinospora soyae]|uniref:Uncharacterized protein n=1 Tax=Plantactinospora soyae TaxID=1544732 RepID=A0A927M7J8_9ACTN|nr:hypothetical protein [Plantactinospora soyae]
MKYLMLVCVDESLVLPPGDAAVAGTPSPGTACWSCGRPA